MALGLLVVAFPLVINYIYTPGALRRASDELQTIDADEIAENQRMVRETMGDREDHFNFEEVEFLDTRFKRYEFDREGVIGIIHIPSVQMEVPIFYGVSNAVLDVGAGTMKPDQEMGRGNYALAGHNSLNPELYFAPIHRMEVGDVIAVTDKKWTYIYETTSIEIVDPDAVHVIEDVEGVTEITLVSCTRGGEQRLIVKGRYLGREEFGSVHKGKGVE